MSMATIFLKVGLARRPIWATCLDFLPLIIPHWMDIRQDFDSSLHEIFKKGRLLVG